MTLTSSGEDHHYYHGLNLFPPTDSRPAWRWQTYDPEMLATESHFSAASAPTPLPETDVSTETDPTLTNLLLGASHRETTTGLAAVSAAGDNCPYQTKYWVRSDANTILEKAKLQRVRTLGKVSVKYQWSNTKRTVIEAAVSFEGSVLFDGGYRKVQSSGSGINFNVPTNRWKDIKAQFDFRAWSLYCHNPYDTDPAYYTGKYEWRPYVFTGGNGKGKPPVDPWHCGDYSVPLGDPLWVSREASTTFGAGVLFPGLNLGARQTNSEKHKLTFTPEGRGARICGKGAWPTKAKLVREDG